MWTRESYKLQELQPGGLHSPVFAGVFSAELSATPIGNAREKSILPHVFCRRNGERTCLNHALAVFSERSAPCRKQLQRFATHGVLSEPHCPAGGETSSLSQAPLQKRRKCGMLAHTSRYQSVCSMCGS